MLLMSCVCHAFTSVFAAVWSPAGKGLTSWLLFVMFNCVFITFPCGILGQVWYLIVLFPDLRRISYLDIFYWAKLPPMLKHKMCLAHMVAS